MAADQRFRLVNRVWPGRWMFQRKDDQGRQVYTDRPSEAVLFTSEMAVHLRDRLRELGNKVFVEDLEGNTLFERETVEESKHDTSRSPRFVPFTNGLGLIVTPGNTPSGPCWFVRAADVPAFAAEGRHTAIESVFGNTPVEAAQRAADTWGQQILFRDPAQDEREREELKKANSLPPGVVRRPGDRH